MNWFAIGAGLAVALSGAIALLRHRTGQATPLSRPTAWVLLVLGLAVAALGGAPALA